MKALLCLVLLFDLSALSEAPQFFSAMPIDSDAASHALSFAPANQTIPGPGFVFGTRTLFDL